VTPSKSTVGLLIGTSVDDTTFSGHQEVSQTITAAVQFKIECLNPAKMSMSTVIDGDAFGKIEGN
jgi:hypothetical protein